MCFDRAHARARSTSAEASQSLRREWNPRKISIGLASAMGSHACFGLPEVLVHEGDRHAALAYRRRDPLHGAESDVAASENARDARLEAVRVPVELPRSRGVHVGAGEHVEDEESTRLKPDDRYSGNDHAVFAPG